MLKLQIKTLNMQINKDKDLMLTFEESKYDKNLQDMFDYEERLIKKSKD